MSASGGAVLARRFSLGLRSTLQCCRGVCPCLCPSSHFCCRVFHRFTSSVAVLRGICARFVPGVAVLAGRCPRFAHSLAFLLSRFASVHACCLPHGDKQDGLRCLAFLFRRSRSPSCVLAVLARLSASVGSLRVCTFICGDLDGVTGVRGRGNGERGWRRGFCALLRKHIGLDMLSAGSTLGLRAPNLRQRVFDSLDSLHAAAGLGWCEYAALVRFCAAALALQRFPRGIRWGSAPQTCAKESNVEAALPPLWTLFTLRRGCVGADAHLCKKRQRPNHRTHARKTRVHGKTRPALIYGRPGRAVQR